MGAIGIESDEGAWESKAGEWVAPIPFIGKAAKGAKGVIGAFARCDSFVPGTKVQLANGTSKPIEELSTNDEVLATDPETGETSAKAVTATIYTEDDKKYVDLGIQTDDGIKTITTTAHHPFWSETDQKWKDAGELKPGTTLRTDDGTPVTVDRTRAYQTTNETYNLTVADLHTYYVLAGATPVLVHNCNLPDGDAVPGIVFRALAQGEDPALGLAARAPDAVNVTPLSHVAGKRQSPWISTTKLPGTAASKYNQGYGVVAIDLSRVPGRIEDVSGGFPGKGRVDVYARKDQEVLIFQRIPARAIIGFWE
ncbi:HINT domain-containing protein [Streptomyces sp. NBC_00555]|uniref:polymorphic toxin-type HINT domain-containing protein n=1 Tax=Streptomyces sp. NBC_00555 TaxID=2903662 RepID=UPI002259E7DE|nr:polymorphic toxin-type HINT domain-containing protein [Streptomyces sp. NBC_00555]MCX5009444.1 HINT domain-containing protein [Streptomyces sp. NBC_00555]